MCLVIKWPGSMYNTKYKCCYPTTGKPATNFLIHGLWPVPKYGKTLVYCDPYNLFDVSQISDIRINLENNWPSLACPSNNGEAFWSKQWEKHGTCSGFDVDQHRYFKAALDLKKNVDLLKILQSKGVHPNGGFYHYNRIIDVIERTTRHTPGIRCNFDAHGNLQLFQIYLCVDTSASKIIKCPRFTNNKCRKSKIAFPVF